MSFNQILAKKAVGTIVKDGKTIALSVATKTTHWDRPEAPIKSIGDSLNRSVSKWDNTLPEGTKEICAREAQHPVDEPRKHLTVVCFDAEGKGKSQHIPFVDESK